MFVSLVSGGTQSPPAIFSATSRLSCVRVAGRPAHPALTREGVHVVGAEHRAGTQKHELFRSYGPFYARTGPRLQRNIHIRIADYSHARLRRHRRPLVAVLLQRGGTHDPGVARHPTWPVPHMKRDIIPAPQSISSGPHLLFPKRCEATRETRAAATPSRYSDGQGSPSIRTGEDIVGV